MAKRMKLKLLRVANNLTQEEIAERIGGISRRMYADIELGKRKGSRSFWERLQQEFNIPDNEMWGLMSSESCEKPNDGNTVD